MITISDTKYPNKKLVKLNLKVKGSIVRYSIGSEILDSVYQGQIVVDTTSVTFIAFAVYDASGNILGEIQRAVLDTHTKHTNTPHSNNGILDTWAETQW